MRQVGGGLLWGGAQGLDPTVDLSFLGADLKMIIQGRASSWQDHLVLTYSGSKAGTSEPLPHVPVHVNSHDTEEGFDTREF